VNITPAGLQLLFQQLETSYQRAYEATPTVYQDIATVIPSKSRETHYGWMDKLPMVREWLGERVVQNVVAQEYTLKNRKWELTYSVKREDIEDELTELYSMGPQMLGEQAAIHPDELMVQVIEGGTTTLTFDSANFYSSSHPIDTTNSALGVQSNYFTTSTSGAMPLTATNVGVGIASMRKFVGRDGKRLNINPTHIMVGPVNEQAALQIANMSLIAPSAAFGINASGGYQENVLKGRLKVIVNPRLTSDTAWYLLDLSRPLRPFVFQNRKPAEFTYMVNPNDPNVWELDQYEYGSRARYNAGYGLWFLSAKFDTV
jgi:phage major head subunit gpT-like protein